MIENYTDPVDADYEMDPTTEDLLFAEDLRPGMIVLIEQTKYRKASKAYMWAEVCQTKHFGSTVAFVFKYFDGTKRTFMYGVEAGFYVKFVSIPAKPVEEPSMTEHDKRLQAASTEFGPLFSAGYPGPKLKPIPKMWSGVTKDERISFLNSDLGKELRAEVLASPELIPVLDVDSGQQIGFGYQISSKNTENVFSDGSERTD